MRKPFIAGNWKMFMTIAEARHLVSELVPGLQAITGVEKAALKIYTGKIRARIPVRSRRPWWLNCASM